MTDENIKSEELEAEETEETAEQAIYSAERLA